ncbi:MAG: hypothetical protein HFJ73_03350 [Eggerthellaceae bacterium]|jgi:hypothetical protein|nr:hypothetical protein [Eggerthellaceae bacterium]
MSDKDILKEALACAYKYWPRIDDLPEHAHKKDKKRHQVVREGTAKWRDCLYRALVEALPRLEVIDYTDDDGDACCVGYRILLHPDQPLLDNDRELLEALGNVRYDLEVYCSMLAPFFYMACVKTSFSQLHDGERWVFSSESAPFPSVPIKVMNVLKEAGFSELPRSVALHEVPDLDVEFVEQGKAILFGCLFEPLFSESVRHSGRIWEQRGEDIWCSW